MRLPLACLAAVTLLALAARAEAPPPLTFGIPRPYDLATTHGDARMLEGYLSSALKRPVQSRTFADYGQLADALAKGQIDLAWITPLAYVNASAQAAVVPIAKALRHGLFYRSCVYVRADSKFQKLADLAGHRAAWVDRESTSGYLLPRGLLLEAGLDPTGFFSREAFAGDHKTACVEVLGGKADVGGTYTDLNSKQPVPVGCGDALGATALAKLRCLAVSDPIPNEVIAGRPGLDDALAGELGSIFARLSETDAGRQLLTQVFRADGFGVALEEDFDGLRKVARNVAAGRWSDAPVAKRHRSMLLDRLEAPQKAQKQPARRHQPRHPSKAHASQGE